MAQPRMLAPWKGAFEKPEIYHVVARIVDRRFALHSAEKEKFRTFMRMAENFSGCRVLSYCLMSNHFHILLEIPPVPVEGISDAELLRRVGALYSAGKTAEIAKELAKWRKHRGPVGEREVARLRESFLHRMHDLSEFMKTLLQRFSSWFNRSHARTGRLWEQRFKSVIVESGTAARVMAAYIDLNPVRAGMVEDPADYRWSSYGEAVNGGRKGNGKKAREGLVRAILAAEGVGFDAGRWREVSREYRELMTLALERKAGRFDREGAERRNADGRMLAAELPMARMLAGRVRYFTDGAVIGSRGFVDEFFRESRDRFGPRRKSGARKMRGAASTAAGTSAGTLWSVRDLRVDVG